MRPRDAVATRARVFVSGHSLDRELAAGIDAEGSDALRMRSRQLLRPSHRRRLAGRLEWIMRKAEEADPESRSEQTIDSFEVKKAHVLLAQLAEWLRGSEPLDPCGVAIVSCLVGNADSPVFAPGWRLEGVGRQKTLAQRAREALACFDRRREARPAPPAAPELALPVR